MARNVPAPTFVLPYFSIILSEIPTILEIFASPLQSEGYPADSRPVAGIKWGNVSKTRSLGSYTHQTHGSCVKTHCLATSRVDFCYLVATPTSSGESLLSLDCIRTPEKWRQWWQLARSIPTCHSDATISAAASSFPGVSLRLLRCQSSRLLSVNPVS